ncbi:MAG TPA: transcriptional repressor [Thermoanaerobaculia bacterium]
MKTADHPSADRVWHTVAESFPAISRATVYNTLHLFVEKGLLREVHLDPERIVFDPKLETHMRATARSTTCRGTKFKSATSNRSAAIASETIRS